MNQAEVTIYRGHKVAVGQKDFVFMIYWNDLFYYKVKSRAKLEQVLDLIKSKIDFLEN